MPSDPEQSLQGLREEIARRKRSDRFFGVVGAMLVVASLLVLFALLANLAKDGAVALVNTHEAKADQSGFANREVPAALLLRDDSTWTAQLDPVRVTGVPADALEPLVGRRVAISARRLPDEDRILKARKVLESTGDDADALLTGTLTRRRAPAKDSTPAADEFWLHPDPIALDMSKLDPRTIKSGSRYAVEFANEPRGNRGVAVAAVPLVVKNFFTSFPSRKPERAGILSAWVGTLLIMLVTMVLAIPLGVAAGVYLEEYAPRNRITSIIEVNIANLAGVPSIIWGLMALGLFVYGVQLAYKSPPHVPNPAAAKWYDRNGDGIIGTPTAGRTILTAGMTLGLLVLPIVIIATRESVRAVPNTIREAAIALGATRWQTTRYHIIPYSMSGILTGSIIAMSRAIGETAPLVTIGALTFIAFLPPAPIERRVSDEDRVAYHRAAATNPAAPPPPQRLHVQPLAWLNSQFTVLPVQLFQWVSRPQKEFHHNAAATGIVLLGMTLSLNGTAIYIRFRLRRKLKW